VPPDILYLICYFNEVKEMLENTVNREPNSQQEYQYRKVQGIMGEHSFSFVIPKGYATQIGIGKGDFVKVILEKDQLVVKKA
jgi:hypothetical protein